MFWNVSKFVFRNFLTMILKQTANKNMWISTWQSVQQWHTIQPKHVADSWTFLGDDDFFITIKSSLVPWRNWTHHYSNEFHPRLCSFQCTNSCFWLLADVSSVQILSGRTCSAVWGLRTTITWPRVQSSPSHFESVSFDFFLFCDGFEWSSLKNGQIYWHITPRKMNYSQSHLGWHFRKIKTQSSNVSFTTFQWKETFKGWVLSFETTFENVTPSGIDCIEEQPRSQVRLHPSYTHT